MDYLKYFKERFDIKEIVPRSVYDEIGDAAWLLFDYNLLKGAGWLRYHLGAAVCNNWHIGGDNHWRGLRTPASPYYSPTSQHTITADHKCRALDLTFLEYDNAEKVREAIRELDDSIGVLYIKRIEDDVNWIHCDVKPTDKDKVYFFKP